MDEQRELKTDLTSIAGAIETQEGVFIPLKEVKRLLLDRIRLVENNGVLIDVNHQREQFFALLKYTMPQQFTDVALKNIVKGFIEESN